MIDPQPQTFPQQLTFRLSLDDDATFKNFFCGSEGAPNNQIVHVLENALQRWVFQSRAKTRSGTLLEEFFWLWGVRGVGCSHLLQAICHEAELMGVRAFYLDFSRHTALHPDVLLGLESMALVCLDAIDELAGQPEWEMALFNLYNRMAESQTPLLIGAHSTPQQLQFKLPDLTSRMQSAVPFHLQMLNDEEKAVALKLRADCRGFELSDEVARFLVARSERSMTQLLAVLALLDKHSLSTQRKVTIPLLKSVMGW
ncbi:MAG: DnaA regulatory inactivator Hda [Pseudohongiella sp.]|nr:DnaA regulatory inactivator Hda [Pseudohongiella sp.]